MVDGFWYDQIQELFDVVRSLQKQFQADDRVREAEAAVFFQKEVTGVIAEKDALRLLLVCENAETSET